VKIALGQINTKIGDFEGIVRKVRSFIHKAKKGGAELALFPEMTTTGYPPRDLVEIPSFVEGSLKAAELIAREADGIAVIFGMIARNERPGGKPLRNAAAFCRDRKIEAIYAKNLLPTYDVFDEGRYFEPGQEAGLWGWEKRIGISICEDCWNDKLFWEKRLYPRDPIEEQVQKGAELLINISASPFSVGKERVRREMLSALALRHGLPLLYVNQVGGNDELVFDGQSLMINSRGEILAEGKAFQEDLIIADLSDRSGLSDLSDLSDLESIYHALIIGIRDYLKKCGFKRLALGLSGGIDSSLTAVLAAAAAGPKNVTGLILPSPYTSRESLEDARQVARNIGIAARVIPITPLYRTYRQVWGRRGSPDLADENIQARIRGNLLMTLSNRSGYLVLSTGNKSELSVGYCTLYGDMSGGLSVLSDLPKTMVYELSRWINRKRGVIPERIFTKAPTAELKPNQTDQDTLPPYEILDPILKAYIEEQRSADEIVALGFSRKTVQWVIRRVDQNEYKRRQAAPGIRVTSKAFGIGRRFPIARKV